jgi:hypothetical protein
MVHAIVSACPTSTRVAAEVSRTVRVAGTLQDGKLFRPHGVLIRIQVEPPPIVDGVLIKVGQQRDKPVGSLVRVRNPRGISWSIDEEGRKRAVRAVVIVHRQTNLLQLALATGTPGCFAGLLHSRQQQRDQHCQDRNDHQQFNQSETSS